jgi:hypothetical protein
MFANWLRHRSPRPAVKRPGVRPRLEVLEDRTVLSPTTTTLTASANPATVVQPITFTATVTGGDFGDVDRGGSVKFMDGTTVLATVDTSNGFRNSQARFTTILALGKHSITAVFSGESFTIDIPVPPFAMTQADDPSTSNVVNEAVTLRPITAALVTRKVGAAHRLFVRVSFADTGAVKAEVRSPFQRPAFRAIAAAAIDGDGDGVADSVRLTARKGKKTFTRFLAL